MTTSDSNTPDSTTSDLTPSKAHASRPDPVPLIDLKAQYLAQQSEIDAAIAACVAGGWYVLGAETAAFEQEFAAYVQGDSQGASERTLTCVGVNSGTDALQLALRACEVGPGDEVITVAHTAVATAAAIVLTGAKPVFVDIDPLTYTMDPQALAGAISSRTKAVIPVHLYGQAADLAAILEIAQGAGVPVIEDCAQAHGARDRGRRVGSWGDLACFSFYPTKNLGALGDGGAVVGPSGPLMARVALLREYGWTPQARYISQIHGMNSRLDEIQAAVLRVKLRTLDAWNDRRIELAARYAQALSSSLTLPVTRAGANHVYHLYVVRVPRRLIDREVIDRDDLRAQLQAAGIGSAIHYPVPIHRQPAYGEYASCALPATEEAADEILSLPMHPFLTDDDVLRVAQAVNRVLADAL